MNLDAPDWPWSEGEPTPAASKQIETGCVKRAGGWRWWAGTVFKVLVSVAVLVGLAWLTAVYFLFPYFLGRR
jgi:hypothetical protein